MKTLKDLIQGYKCVAMEGHRDKKFGDTVLLYFESQSSDLISMKMSLPVEVLDEYDINWYQDSATWRTPPRTHIKWVEPKAEAEAKAKAA